MAAGVLVGVVASLAAAESVPATPGIPLGRTTMGVLGDAGPLPAWLSSGYWVEQIIEVPEDGPYDLVVDGTMSHSNTGDSGILRLEVDGETVIQNVGGSERTTAADPLVVHERLHFTAGSHSLRLFAEYVAGGFDFLIYEWYRVPYKIQDFWLTPSVQRRGSVVLAGGSEPGYADGVGINARFGSDFIACAGSDGGLLVGDSANHRIRRVTPEGAVTTLAGSGDAGHTDGYALQATFWDFTGLAGTADGNVWILDNDPQVAGGDPERLYHVRRLSSTGEVSTVWQGSIATGAPAYNPEYWLPNEQGAQFYLLHGLFEANGGALLLRGSYWFCWDYALETCDGGPCNIHTACRTDRDVILLMADGSPEKTDEHWDAKQPLSNAAGVVFFGSGDRLLRQPPDGHPQTIYRNPALRTVASVQAEEVWVTEGARVMRVLDDEHPGCDLQVEVVGGTGRVEGLPAWPVVPGTRVTVMAIPTGEAQFSHWTGDATGSKPVISVVLERDMRLKAHLGYPLEVSANGANVEFEPDLPLYPLGLEVAVSATPDAGLDSIGWSDGGGDRTRWVKVDGPWSILVAGYRSSSQPAANLRTSVLPPHSGTVEKTQFIPYHVGTPIWLSAVASSGYPFLHWSDGSTEAQRLVYAPDTPLELVAEFGAPPAAHTVVETRGLTVTGKVRVVVRGTPGFRYQLQQRLDQSGWQTLWNGIMPATGETEYWVRPLGRMAFYRASFGP
ncbi:MAG: hypothetical protein H7A46_26235 [Verrucomicrobiales bacterium]|nr:hypothetical protein [Verrucomicrobiales bacterium]